MSNTRIVEADLRLGPSGVIYLEGKTDPELFFALLGIPRPPSDVHNNVFVKGLKSGGSGRQAVQDRVRIGRETLNHKVIGLIDGDGLSESLVFAGSSVHEQAGPLYTLSTYSLENYLATTDNNWPEAWGEEPDWEAVLKGYSPYVALNILHSQLLTILRDLELHNFTNPRRNETLKSLEDTRDFLALGGQAISDFNILAEFDAALEKYQSAIDRSLAEGHSYCNGKWLIDHYLPTRLSLTTDILRTQWCQEIQSAGGNSDVIALWKLFTGELP